MQRRAIFSKVWKLPCICPMARPFLLPQIVWLRTLLNYRASVLPAIVPRVLFCGGFGAIVTVLHRIGWPVALPALGGLIPSIVLGLLLVFRTNTAYDRFWEGRKLWGQLINTTRNLARHLWVAIEEKDPGDRAAKIAALQLLVAYARTTKQHLRRRPLTADIAALMDADQFQTLQQLNNPPLEIALRIGQYIQAQHHRGRINTYQLVAATSHLDAMVDILGGCERIVKTPIPPAYSVHLKQLLLIYCLSLPFELVDRLGAWTGLAVATIAFTIFGIEAIGLEIENPFGNDPNDLPLDTICDTMERNIEDLISLSPGSLSDGGAIASKADNFATPESSEPTS